MSRATVGLYLLARVWQLLFLGRPVTGADTPMYRSAGQRWLDFPGRNFLGHTLRPWPITLLYSVAPTDTWRVLAQFAIAMCCWSFCIWQFGRLTPNRTVAVVASCAVAVLALTLGVSGFDGVLLSESLTLSLVALYVGAILSVCGGRGRLPTLAAALVAACLLGLLRPVLLPLAPGVALVAWLVRRRPGREDRRPSPAAVLILCALSVGAVAYGWTYNVQVDRTWGEWLSVPGLNGRTLTQYYLAAYETPSGPSLIDAMVAAGAPRCLQPNPAPAILRKWRDFFKEDRFDCPQGQAWLSAHYVPTLTDHLAAHPDAARRYFADALSDESVLRTDGGPSVPIVIPGPVADLFFSQQRGFGDPLLVWSILALGALGAWSFQLRRARGNTAARRSEPARGRRDVRAGGPALSVVVGCVLLAGYAALVATALLSATDASRVALPVTVLIRLLLIVAVSRAAASVLAPGRAPSTIRWPMGPVLTPANGSGPVALTQGPTPALRSAGPAESFSGVPAGAAAPMARQRRLVVACAAAIAIVLAADAAATVVVVNRHQVQTPARQEPHLTR